MFTTVYGDNTWQNGSPYFLRKIRGKRPNTVRLRYGYNRVGISAPDNTIYYGPKADRIDTVYGRKCPVFTPFTVRFRIVNGAVLIDLGHYNGFFESQFPKDLNQVRAFH